jgi:hypothetical protein
MVRSFILPWMFVPFWFAVFISPVMPSGIQDQPIVESKIMPNSDAGSDSRRPQLSCLPAASPTSSVLEQMADIVMPGQIFDSLILRHRSANLLPQNTKPRKRRKAGSEGFRGATVAESAPNLESLASLGP